MSIIIVENTLSLKSAQDLVASVKQGNKCQMCALTHLFVEMMIRTFKSLAVWYCCVCVCAPGLWFNFMHIPTSGKILS